MRLLHATRPKYLHMGLPCGTCSRARGGPPPLRDEYHLMGLPGLGALDSAKVASANALYRFAVQVLHTCMLLSVLVSVENPTRSWLWRILAFLIRSHDDTRLREFWNNLRCNVFDACMHGSRRDKSTMWRATPGVFECLQVVCSGDHVHASWQPQQVGAKTLFPTAEEAEYPPLLCKRVAACVKEALVKQGVASPLLTN